MKQTIRLTGHALMCEGAAFDDQGRVLGAGYVERKGPGRAQCECGTLSEVLPSGAARRRWHVQEHKPEMRAAAQTGDPR